MCDDCSDTTSTSDTSCDTSSDTYCETSTTETMSELPEDTGDLTDDGSDELVDISEDDSNCENTDHKGSSEFIDEDGFGEMDSEDVVTPIDEGNNAADDQSGDVVINSKNDLNEDTPDTVVNNQDSVGGELYPDGSEDLLDGNLNDGEERSDFDEIKSSKDIVGAEEYNNYKEFYDFADDLDVSQDYKDKLLDSYKTATPEMKQMYNEYAPYLKCNDSNYTSRNKYGQDIPDAYFNEKEKGFKFNQGFDANNELGACNDFFHESGHMIDWLKRDRGFLGVNQKNFSEKNDFTSAIKNDYNNAINRFKEQEIDKYFNIERDAGFNTSREQVADLNKKFIEQDATDRMREMLWDGENKTTMSTISDVFGGTTYYSTGSQVRGEYGHPDSYWASRDPSIIGKEAYAGISAAYMTNNQVAIDKLNSWMPETMSLYNKQLSNKRS